MILSQHALVSFKVRLCLNRHCRLCCMPTHTALQTSDFSSKSSRVSPSVCPDPSSISLGSGRGSWPAADSAEATSDLPFPGAVVAALAVLTGQQEWLAFGGSQVTPCSPTCPALRFSSAREGVSTSGLGCAVLNAAGGTPAKTSARDWPQLSIGLMTRARLIITCWMFDESWCTTIPVGYQSVGAEKKKKIFGRLEMMSAVNVPQIPKVRLQIKRERRIRRTMQQQQHPNRQEEPQ